MNDDGTMARRPDLEVFAEQHGIKIGTIADLIHHRIAHEKTVKRVKVRQIDTEYGAFELRTYLDEARDEYHHALVKGNVSGDEPVLVRVHIPSPLRDFFTLHEPGKPHYPRWTFHKAMKQVSEEKNGAVILINADHGSSGREVEASLEEAFGDRVKSSQPGSEHIQFQQVGVGSQILRELGIKKLRLMGAPIKYAGLSGFDLEVVENIEAEE
jgi:3,4-dihydroxy 2-butanone 4-phosphate synthase/GTP cyclohydrolase II